MSRAPEPGAAAPSVFISYASEDRGAARRLRDALSAAGLEVWYDENELGGGDAWDQKIRRQIRECTYFMPLVSATTERRHEGYFRREWRLGSERTLDMADDVLFLLPIVIDETQQDGARVPEKFLTVQWLRCMEGQPTPALQALCERLLAGNQRPAAPRSSGSRPAEPRRQTAEAGARREPPPLVPPVAAAATATPEALPPFPTRTASKPGGRRSLSDRLDFLGACAWWLVSVVRILFLRLPRWGRIVLSFWVVIYLLFSGSSDRKKTTSVTVHPTRDVSPDDATLTATSEAADKALSDVAANLDKAAKEAGDTSPIARNLSQAGSEIARRLTQKNSGARRGSRVVTVPFATGVADAESAASVSAVFNAFFGEAAVALGNEITVLPAATGETAASAGAGGEADYRALAQAAHHRFLITAQTQPVDGAPGLVVHLVKVDTGTDLWTGQYILSQKDPATTAHAIAQAVVKALPAN